ncbi:MAG: hypothetical protein AB7F30_07255 [Flavobacteriaceae bacterium]
MPVAEYLRHGLHAPRHFGLGAHEFCHAQFGFSGAVTVFFQFPPPAALSGENGHGNAYQKNQRQTAAGEQQLARAEGPATDRQHDFLHHAPINSAIRTGMGPKREHGADSRECGAVDPGQGFAYLIGHGKARDPAYS